GGAAPARPHDCQASAGPRWHRRRFPPPLRRFIAHWHARPDPPRRGSSAAAHGRRTATRHRLVPAAPASIRRPRSDPALRASRPGVRRRPPAGSIRSSRSGASASGHAPRLVRRTAARLAAQPMSRFKQRMIRAFDAAASYDDVATVQQQVASALAGRIAALALPERARILEVGCGTGFVAAAMPSLPRGSDWLMTDVSPAMVKRARQRFLGQSGYRFAVLDAEHPVFNTPEEPFDLVCSSLAAQWFEDLPKALEQLFQLLNPGGYLLISTLGAGTFAEWRAAHD